LHILQRFCNFAVQIDEIYFFLYKKQFYKMKLIKHLSTIICITALISLAACEMTVPPFGPTDRPDNGEPPIVVPTEAPDTAGWNIPAEAITVAEARDICAGLESGSTSGTKYYVMGWVKKIHDQHTSGVIDYGNARFYIEDIKGKNSTQDFMAFQVYGIGGSKITDPASVLVGDFVVIYGELTNYNGTYETVGKGAAYIWRSTNPLLAPAQPKPEEVTILESDLSTSAEVNKFAAANITGEGTWKYNRTGKCAQITGANNEDWFISPAINLAGMSEASLNFKYKFSESVAAEYQSQYTVWISKDYVDDVKTATWVQLEGYSYDETSFAESNTITLPSEMIGETCHIAWKYNTGEVSHTWSLKDIIVKAMTKVD
jgi:hypothetical protein